MNQLTAAASQKCSRYPEGCAAPSDVQCQGNARAHLSKLKETSPHRKINVTSKSPVGDISVVTLIRTDTTLDHSQKAEKVCDPVRPPRLSSKLSRATGVFAKVHADRYAQLATAHALPRAPLLPQTANRSYSVVGPKPP